MAIELRNLPSRLAEWRNPKAVRKEQQTKGLEHAQLDTKVLTGEEITHFMNASKALGKEVDINPKHVFVRKEGQFKHEETIAEVSFQLHADIFKAMAEKQAEKVNPTPKI